MAATALKNKVAYVKKNWPDIVACIPVSQEFRFFRLIRLLRVRRIFRLSYRRQLVAVWREQAAESFIFLLFTAILPVTFFAIWLILHIEEHATGSNIHTLPDATWWFWVTITTVGYGDHYPVTFAGRMLAGGVMLVGIAAFSAMTALLAARLNERWSETHPSTRELEYRQLRQQIDRMEKALCSLEQQALPAKRSAKRSSSCWCGWVSA